MSIETTTPAKYKFLEKDYNLSDLRSLTDKEVSEYISKLKRGKEDNDLFFSAYNNMMAGIENGTITFEGGRFRDRKSGYTNNTKDRDKDYYGHMANFIFDKMNEVQALPEETPKEDTSKIKWDGRSSLGTGLSRFVFNEDSPSNRTLDFIDIDKDITSLTGRTSKISAGLLDFIDHGKTQYSDMSDEDYDKYSKMAKALVDNLNKGIIDYNGLDSLIGGWDFRKLFTTTKDETPTQADGDNSNSDKLNLKAFNKWLIANNYNPYKGTLYNPITLSSDTTGYSPTEVIKLKNLLKSNYTTTETLLHILDNIEKYPNYKFVYSDGTGDWKYLFKSIPESTFSRDYIAQAVLNELKSRNNWSSFGDNDQYYRVGDIKRNNNQSTSWVWDTANNLLMEMYDYLIPSRREALRNQYVTSTEGTSEEELPDYLQYYLKKGGVLKALNGLSVMPKLEVPNLPKTEISPDVESFSKLNYGTNAEGNLYGYDDYLSEWTPELSNASRDSSKIGNPTPTIHTAFNKLNEYMKSNNVMLDVQNAFKNWKLSNADAKDEDFLQYYNNLVDVIRNRGLKRATDKVGSKGYRDMFDAFNTLYASRANDFTTNGSLGAQDNLGDELGSSMLLRNALAFGSDNDFADKRLGELSEGGLKVWIDNEGKLQIKKDPENSATPEQNPKLPVEDDKTGKSTFINRYNNFKNSVPDLNGNSRANLWIKGISDLAGIGRLVNSIVTNNKVADVVDKSIRAPLKEVAGLRPQVVEDKATRDFYFNLAADVLNMSKRIGNSDPSLDYHAQLQAYNYARGLQEKGYLASNSEWKRTSENAFKYADNLLKDAVNNTNDNNKSLNLAGRERAQLEADRLKANFTAADNFAQELITNWRNRAEESKKLGLQFRMNALQSKVEENYKERIKQASEKANAWLAANSGKDLTLMPGYSNYNSLIEMAKKWKEAELLEGYNDIYDDSDFRYQNPYKKLDWNKEVLKYSFKNGGKLFKNESNS